jgi:hypothetical protein
LDEENIGEGMVRKISYFSFHLNSIFTKNRENNNSSTSVFNKRADIIMSFIYLFCSKNDVPLSCEDDCLKCEKLKSKGFEHH